MADFCMSATCQILSMFDLLWTQKPNLFRNLKILFSYLHVSRIDGKNKIFGDSAGFDTVGDNLRPLSAFCPALWKPVYDVL